MSMGKLDIQKSIENIRMITLPKINEGTEKSIGILKKYTMTCSPMKKNRFF